ncbi:MAG: hypothetical protein K2G13_03650 [Muribaculaceae bacterium]|nr:hypothetical protein [Muribaculaceae bacterium]
MELKQTGSKTKQGACKWSLNKQGAKLNRELANGAETGRELKEKGS